MKTTIFKSIKITLVFSVFFTVCYVLVLWLFAQFAGPNKGKPEMLSLNDQIVGAALVGQKFTKDTYFWGRPSANDYKANASAGSNKGPTNEVYLTEVENRIDSFMVHHPYLKRSEVPAEMVTASGSGLDPDITPECAYLQVKRVAQARGINEKELISLVDRQIEKPFLGLFGPAKVNVLKLNVALEKIPKP